MHRSGKKCRSAWRPSLWTSNSRIHDLGSDDMTPCAVQRHRTPAGVDPPDNCRSSRYVELGGKAFTVQHIWLIGGFSAVASVEAATRRCAWL